MRRPSGVRLGPLVVCILVFTFALVASGAAAESVVEAWRSVPPAFNKPYSVSVNPTDGSCWVADLYGARVVHLSAAGEELWRSASGAFPRPTAVSVNPTDGSCWVAGYSQVVHLSAAGEELWRRSGVGDGRATVSVNPADGSCWVAEYYNHQVWHFSAAGEELWRSDAEAFICPTSVSVNPTDGSCRVTDRGQPSGDTRCCINAAVVSLSAAGEELWRSAPGAVQALGAVSVNPTDGSCWVTDNGHTQMVHFSATGEELWRSASGAFFQMESASVNPTDGSCWVADSGDFQVVHLSATGEELWRSDRGAFDSPASVSVNPTDGSCWVADYTSYQVVHLSETGEELWRSDLGAICGPESVSANPADGSCWVAAGGYVVHLSKAGVELGRSDSSLFNYPWRVSVNPTDGSCWVADWSYAQVVHVVSGTVEALWQSDSGTFTGPTSVSVNPTDGSCWVGDRYSCQVVHLAADWVPSGPVLARVELGRSDSGLFEQPESVSVNPTDGSCWVAVWAVRGYGTGEYGPGYVAHLSEAGEELWRSASGAFDRPQSVSVNPADGSCWVADWGFAYYGQGQVVHLSATGEELWRSAGGAFSGPRSVSVDSTDGSCWVGDTFHSQVVHLSAAGEELWRSAAAFFVYSVSVDSTDGSCWVADYIHSQVGSAGVSRGMGDTGGNQVVRLVVMHFSDLSSNHWALAYIEACARAGIVGGYSDGTYRPSLPVTRDAMAVFISRALAGGDSLVPTGPATATFSDVPTGYWAFKYVEYAVDNGVVGGYSDGTYRPTVTVTRDQMAVFVARAIVGGDAYVPTGPSVATFPDVPTDYWAFKYVEYIKTEGVTGGYPDGTYRPTEAVTRDQMAVYIQRAFHLPM